MSYPLNGIKVLDLTNARTGPFSTQILADFGAEVIKIERVKSGESGRSEQPLIEGQSTYFYAVNRNKKSLTLNLKEDQGREVFKSLADDCDVIVVQFRPGVMERLGLGYETLKEKNPRLIYCSLTGFGTNGAMSSVAGHDINYQSISGLLGLTGTRKGIPAISQVPLAGFAGGAMYTVVAILLALLHREKTGMGQFCDVAMLDSAISYLSSGLAAWSGYGELPRMGMDVLTGGNPSYNVYETSDHQYIALGALEPKFWEGFCRKVERLEWIDIINDSNSHKHLIVEVESLIKTRTKDEWVEFFKNEDICFSPVLSLEEMVNHPQVKARQMICKVPIEGPLGSLHLAGSPIKLSKTPARQDIYFSTAGENNLEILLSAGYNLEEIKTFQEHNII